MVIVTRIRIHTWKLIKYHPFFINWSIYLRPVIFTAYQSHQSWSKNRALNWNNDVLSELSAFGRKTLHTLKTKWELLLSHLKYWTASNQCLCNISWCKNHSYRQYVMHPAHEWLPPDASSFPWIRRCINVEVAHSACKAAASSHKLWTGGPLSRTWRPNMSHRCSIWLRIWTSLAKKVSLWHSDLSTPE